MLTVLAVVLKVHLKARPVSGLAAMAQDTRTSDILATSYISFCPATQAGESGENIFKILMLSAVILKFWNNFDN